MHLESNLAAKCSSAAGAGVSAVCNIYSFVAA